VPPEAAWLPSWHAFVKTVELGSMVAAARTLGKAMADAGIGLVYGGGSLGLMGEVARSVLENSGHVTGIIPEFLANRELRRDAWPPRGLDDSSWILGT